MGKAFSKYRDVEYSTFRVSRNEMRLSLPPKPLAQPTTQKLQGEGHRGGVCAQGGARARDPKMGY